MTSSSPIGPGMGKEVTEDLKRTPISEGQGRDMGDKGYGYWKIEGRVTQTGREPMVKWKEEAQGKKDVGR